MGIIGLTDSQFYHDIADAIRLKAGTSSVYLPSEMALAIRQISGGGAVILQDKTATPSTAVQTIIADSGYDGLGNVTINAMTAGSVAVPTKTINVTPSISVNSNNGVISVSVSGSSSIEPDVEPGYVNQGTAGLISVNGSNSLTMNTKGAATITPSTSKQTIAANQFLTGAQTINAIPSDYIIPSGSQTLTQNRDYDVRALASVTVNVSGDVPALQSKSVSFTPSTVAQNDTVEPDDNYDGLSYVNISVAAMPSGSAGTPVATKGSVSNNQISITPSVSNTTGYISGGTKTGTAVTVKASDLVSGTYTFTAAGTANVTNYAVASVSAGSTGNPVATKGTVSNNSISITPSVSNSTGWITGGTKTGTAITVQASELVSGTKSITSNGSNIDVTNYATVSVNVPTGGQISNQDKSVNPTESQQSITYDNGYTGLGTVTVGAISSDYVGSNIARNTVGDISNPSTQHVSIPAGFYENSVDYLFPVQTSGAKPEIDFNAGTGVITPKFVLDEETEGYYYGTITGNPVQLPTASASTYTPTESEQTILGVGTYITGTIRIAAISSTYVGSNIARKSSADLTASGSVVTAPAGYYSASASKAVAAGSVAVPNKTITANPTISVSAAGVITASVAGSSNVSPTVTAGYVTTGTQGTMSVSGSSTFSLTTQAAATITPSETQQTAVTSGKYTTGNVVVAAISANYIGSGITQRSSTDLTASNSTITAPAGYYASAASKTVSAGTAGTPTATKGTVSNHSISVTPSVTNTTGWITGSTKTGTAVTVNASELVSGSSAISSNGTYDVTNYASAVVSIDYVTYYTGSSTPSSSLGSNGDIYLQT